MVERADAWHWSSARSHVAGKRAPGDPLTDVAALDGHVRNWRAYWRHGAELAEADADNEAMADTIKARLRTGRPLAAEAWIAAQEEASGRAIAKRKPGPKPNREN